MQHKHRLILALIQELRIQPSDAQKYILAYRNNYGINYDFVDGFSFELENDIFVLCNKGYLTQKQYFNELSPTEMHNVKNFVDNSIELRTVPLNIKPKIDGEILFTIGYEGLSIDKYINILLENNIKTLVDVRGNPFSQKFGFSRDELKYFIEKSRIKYISIPQLGTESEKRKEIITKNAMNFGLFAFNEHGRPKIFEEYRRELPSKKPYVNRLLEILRNDKYVAITCFEADHRSCHRHVLAESLDGIKVIHLCSN